MPFPFVTILIQLAVGAAFSILSALILPKPKNAKKELQDLKDPTASAGRTMPIVFGTVTVKGLNVLHYSEKRTSTREV